MLFNTLKPQIKRFLSLLILLTAFNSFALAEDDIAKVVYHADFSDPNRFSTMLQNIFNMTTTYENELRDYDIRVVFIATGIRFITHDNLKGSPVEADKKFKKERADFMKRLASLQEIRGVKLELCTITLNAFGLKAATLIKDVALVPSGVVQVADLQHKGFAYLKI